MIIKQRTLSLENLLGKGPNPFDTLVRESFPRPAPQIDWPFPDSENESPFKIQEGHSSKGFVPETEIFNRKISEDIRPLVVRLASYIQGRFNPAGEYAPNILFRERPRHLHPQKGISYEIYGTPDGFPEENLFILTIVQAYETSPGKISVEIRAHDKLVEGAAIQAYLEGQQRYSEIKLIPLGRGFAREIDLNNLGG